MKFSDRRVQNLAKKIRRESKGWSEGSIIAQINDTHGVDVYHTMGGTIQAYERENWSEPASRIIYEENCTYDTAKEGFDVNQIEVELFYELRMRENIELEDPYDYR